MRTFGGFIRQRRKAMGLTQREFAARIHFEDGHAISFLPIAHLIFDSRNQEITIDNGGKVYVDRGSGALRFTGITIPEMQLRAAIRMLVAASGA